MMWVHWQNDGMKRCRGCGVARFGHLLQAEPYRVKTRPSQTQSFPLKPIKLA